MINLIEMTSPSNFRKQLAMSRTGQNSIDSSPLRKSEPEKYHSIVETSLSFFQRFHKIRTVLQ